jgi:hypothetical protein
MKIKFLITGMPRSGTVYMARLLTSLEIMCGHESIFTPEGIEGAINRLNEEKEIITSAVSSDVKEIWFDHKNQIAESSYLSVPYLDHECLNSCKIIHLVRNPIKVIISIYYDANFWRSEGQLPYKNFVYSHFPELKEIENEIERTVAFYVLWNEKAERKSDIRICVENCHENKKLFNFIEIKIKKNYFKDQKINSWNFRKKDLSLEEIPNGKYKHEFLKKIFNYGYNKLYL